MTLCGGCGKTAGSGTVQCKGCDLWWHSDCAGIQKEMYKLILETSKVCGTHCWCCRVCASVQDGLKKQIIHLETKITTVEGKVEKNTEDIDELKDKVQNIESNGSANQDDIYKELSEREARKANIIVHGIPEPTGETSEKKDKDKAELKSVAAAINTKIDTSRDVKFMFRMGELSKNKTNDSRPLRVGFHDENIAERLRKDSWKLKDNRKIAYQVSITSDLTNKQRSDEEKMRKEAEEMNKNMSKEEAETHCFRLVGKRGHRIITKVKRKKEQEEDQDSQTDNRKRQRSPEASNHSAQAEKTSRK